MKSCSTVFSSRSIRGKINWSVRCKVLALSNNLIMLSCYLPPQYTSTCNSHTEPRLHTGSLQHMHEVTGYYWMQLLCLWGILKPHSFLIFKASVSIAVENFQVVRLKLSSVHKVVNYPTWHFMNSILCCSVFKELFCVHCHKFDYNPLIAKELQIIFKRPSARKQCSQFDYLI